MRLLPFLMVCLAFAGCQDDPVKEEISKLEAPSGLEAELVDSTSVRLIWTDNSRSEKGYRVYQRVAGAEAAVQPLKTIGADAVSFVFEDLEHGETYDFGVQAVAAGTVLHSDIVYLEGFRLPGEKEEPSEDGPGEPVEPEQPQVEHAKVPQVTKVQRTYAYIAVSYKVQKLSSGNPEHGVCFSTSASPTVDDIRVPGPALSANKEIMQVVPNACLEADTEYQMSVFVKDGEDYIYSTPQTVRLEVQPAEINLSWEKQTYSSLPAGVEVYKTVSPLNGRNFNAWYAVADPSEVEFKVLNTPTGKANLKTVSYQAENAEGDCLVLMNGGVFGNYHIGVIHVDGKPQEWVDNVYNNYWNPNGDGSLWNITRPIVGVDKEGKAAAYWTASPQYGTYFYYDMPLPTVPGEAKYSPASANFPVASADWKPYNALSTGPMLLYDGKCCINHEKTASGAYMTNYECWALDIYEGRPDRTAVGVTSDGKIVLFICDGRIDASQGATHEEVAMIMKNIGCVHAMNLDGGGSTGMWVKGSGMINHKDGSWRAVKSTLGFFSK